MENKEINVNGEIIVEVLSEIDAREDINDKIDTLNKLMNNNLLAIYDAVTEINLSDKETYRRVKKLADKQKCYESIRKDLITNQKLFNGKSKR